MHKALFVFSTELNMYTAKNRLCGKSSTLDVLS